MEAIVLAGGFGTRLQTLVNDVPKSMAPVNNKPFLEYLLNYLTGQGVKRVILAVGYKFETIQADCLDEWSPCFVKEWVKRRFIEVKDEIIVVSGNKSYRHFIEAVKQIISCG